MGCHIIKMYVNKPKNALGQCKGNNWRKGKQGKENLVVIKSGDWNFLNAEYKYSYAVFYVY